MIVWTLLRLNPVNQDRYIGHVTEDCREVETYFPAYEKITRPAHKRKPVCVHRPVYPGYVFARIDPESVSVHMLTSRPVRAWFIRFGGIIAIVPDKEILRLQRMEKRGELVQEVEKENPFRPGVKVRVHMPTADMTAIIARMISDVRVQIDTPLGRGSAYVHQLEVL